MIKNYSYSNNNQYYYNRNNNRRGGYRGKLGRGKRGRGGYRGRGRGRWQRDDYSYRDYSYRDTSYRKGSGRGRGRFDREESWKPKEPKKEGPKGEKKSEWLIGRSINSIFIKFYIKQIKINIKLSRGFYYDARHNKRKYFGYEFIQDKFCFICPCNNIFSKNHFPCSKYFSQEQRDYKVENINATLSNFNKISNKLLLYSSLESSDQVTNYNLNIYLEYGEIFYQKSLVIVYYQLYCKLVPFFFIVIIENY